MTLLEFFGHPGAGKSTISHELAKQLSKKDNRVYEPSYDQVTGLPTVPSVLLRLVKVANQTVRRPRQSLRTITDIQSTNQRTAIDLLRVTYYHLYTMNEYHELQPRSAFHVFDQGLIQSVWSIFLTADEPVELTQFIESAPSVSSEWFVVIVETQDEIISHRLRDRTSNQTRIDFGEGLDESLDHFRDMKDAVYDFEELSHRFTTVTVQGDIREDVPVATRKIIDRLVDVGSIS